MIGLVLVTHGALAVEFKSALEHVVGPQEQVQTICIGPDDDMEARRNDIIGAVGLANTGDGVVILTDMFGGTPSNLAISVMKTVDAEVIAGMNLPMLVKLARVRSDMELKQAVTLAAEAGRKHAAEPVIRCIQKISHLARRARGVDHAIAVKETVRRFLRAG